YAYGDLLPYSNSLKWILKGNRRIKEETWETHIKHAIDYDNGKNVFWLKKIRPKVFSELKKSLERTVQPAELPKCFHAAGIGYPVKYWTLIKNLCQLGIRKNSECAFAK